MLYIFTKKQRITFLAASIIVSLFSLAWYVTQASAVSMLLRILAIISLISQLILIKMGHYKA